MFLRVSDHRPAADVEAAAVEHAIVDRDEPCGPRSGRGSGERCDAFADRGFVLRKRVQQAGDEHVAGEAAEQVEMDLQF